MTSKWKRLLGIVVSIQLSALLGWVPSAGAHAAYESSDPANGATVSDPPERVTAEFTEPIVDGSHLEVYDPCGAKVDSGDSFVAIDRVTVSMAADKQGTYTVTFDVVSSVDGHPTNGEFSFVSSGGNPCPNSASEEEGSDDGDEEQTGSGDVEGSADDGAGGSDRSESVQGDDQDDSKIDGRTGKDPKGRQGEERAQVRRRDRSSRPRAAVDIPGDLLAEQGAGGPSEPLPALFLSLLLAAIIGAVAGKIFLKIS